MLMPIAARNEFLRNLHFLTPLFREPSEDAGTRPVWLGDVFSYDRGAFFVPPARGSEATARYHPRHLYWDIHGAPCVDYDVTRTLVVVNVAEFSQRVADEHLKSPDSFYFNQKHAALGQAFTVSPSLEHHLYLARYAWQFQIDHDREKNEALCTALENKGVILPDVIGSGAVFVAPDGYEGPRFLVREDGAWRTVMIGGGFHHDINSSGWRIPAPTHVLFPTLEGYIKEPEHGFTSPTFFKEKVPDRTIQRIIDYELLGLLKSARLSEQSLDTFVHERETTALFRIAGHIVMGRQTRALSDALLISPKSEKTTYDGYAVESYLVPIERTQDPRRIMEVSLRTDKALKAKFALNGAIEETSPSALPPEARDLLELRLASRRPTWDMPLSVTVARDPA
jgi:hypothetical protein